MPKRRFSPSVLKKRNEWYNTPVSATSPKWHTRGRPPGPPHKRWRAQVEKGEKRRDCWKWTGSTDATGRPMFWVRDAWERADIWYWMWRKRKKEDLLELVEENRWKRKFKYNPTCGNIWCVNPAHGRWVPPKKLLPKARGRYHLPPYDIRRIRRRYAEGETISSILRDYPTYSWSGIRAIAQGTSYKNVR